MSSTLPEGSTLDKIELAPGNQAATNSPETAYSPTIVIREDYSSSEDESSSPTSPIVIIGHPHTADDDISEALSPGDENKPNEKAQKIRVIIPKTDAKADNISSGTTKAGTPIRNISKSASFSSFSPFSSSTAASKLRIRTSRIDPKLQMVQWGVHWYQPSSMIAIFVVGVIAMVGHHVYNSHLSGHLVGDPQWPQRFGTALSFFAKMCMVGAVDIAYKQVIWLIIKKRSYTIKTLDGMFSICNDPFKYLNPELLFKATLPAIMAGAIWCLPLCAIISPASLTSIGGTRNTPSTCNDIPTLDFHHENGINIDSTSIYGTGLSFFDPDPNDNITFYWSDASMELQKVAKLAMLSSSPLTLPNPCQDGANCTWSFSFDGPSYDCQEHDDFDNGTSMTKSQLAPMGDNIYFSASSGSEDESGRPTFWQYETWQNDSTIGEFLMEPVMWIGYVYNTSQFISNDDNWPYKLDPHVVACTLYNTTYEYDMSFVNGIMSVDNITKTLIAPALSDGTTIAPTDFNYESFAGYHAAGFLFRDTLSNNITQPTGQGINAFATTNSEVAQTNLVNPDTQFAIPDFPTKVEEQFSNIVLSIAADPSFYSQVNVTGPCVITSAVLQWNYRPFWLVLSYALAAGVGLVGVGAGLYAFRANGYAADTSFSTFLATTRNPSLDALSTGYCLGQTPLPKEFMNESLRFGEIKGYGHDWEGRDHVAFGMKNETSKTVFGKKYA